MILEMLLFGAVMFIVDLSWIGLCYWFGWWRTYRLACKAVVFVLGVGLVFLPFFPWDFDPTVRLLTGGIIGYLGMDTFDVIVEHIYSKLPSKKS